MLFRAAICAWVGLFFVSSESRGLDTAAQLQSSTARMNDWLGTGAAAEGWRRFLLLNVLDSQVALGDRADVQAMNEVLARFQSQAPGLDHAMFQGVRRALEEHVRHVSNITAVDINSAINAAADRFVPIPIETVIRCRDDALSQLRGLDARYRFLVANPELLSTLENLKIDQIITDVTAINPQAVISDGLAPASGNAEQDQARARARNDAIATLRAHVQNFDEQSRNRFDAFFASAQSALDRYFRTLFYASDRDLEQGYARQLQTLTENVPLLNDPQQRRAAGLVGNALGWLDHAQQVPDLVTAIRLRYSQPNLHGEVDGQFINRLVGRDVPETRPVSEVILGRLIQGTSYLNTNVSIDLLHDPNQISASIRALGTIQSDNYTKQGPVTAFSGSNGVFEARRHVLANMGGVYANSPYAAANLESEFRGTNCRLKLVNKFAQKTYRRDKDLSEGIAAGRAEQKILDQFGQQTNESLAGPNSRLAAALQKSRDYFRLIPSIYLHSQQDAVLVTGNRADAYRLAAPQPAPQYAVSADVQFKIHESMLSNTIDPYFAGRTISNEDMAKQAQEMLDRVPEAFKTESEDERWSITFATIQAVQIQIEDNRVVLSLIGRRFTKADQQMRASMIIRMVFQIVRRGDQLVLVRDGLTTVDYEDPSDESARTLAFKTFLADKLNAAEKDGREGILLPPDLIPTDRVDALKNSQLARDMQLVEFTADNGWMTLGWSYRPIAMRNQDQLTHTPAIEIQDESAPPPIPPANDSPAPPQPDDSQSSK